MNTRGIQEFNIENLPKRSGDTAHFYLKDLGTVCLNEEDYITETTTCSGMVKVTKR